MSADIKMKEVTITHKDGTTEQVYVEDDTTDKFSWSKHLPVIYAGVGIIALTMTAFFTYLQIKKMERNG